MVSVFFGVCVHVAGVGYILRDNVPALSLGSELNIRRKKKKKEKEKKKRKKKLQHLFVFS